MAGVRMPGGTVALAQVYDPLAVVGLAGAHGRAAEPTAASTRVEAMRCPWARSSARRAALPASPGVRGAHRTVRVAVEPRRVGHPLGLLVALLLGRGLGLVERQIGV